MLAPALLALAKKPNYTYEPKLGWEKVRPTNGEVRENVADQFRKAQGDENLVESLTSPAVRALLRSEVHLEQNVVLAYHADEAHQAMDQAVKDNLGPKWRQGERSMSAPQPGNNDGYFYASCGGRTYCQELSISSKDQEITLITRGKEKGQGLCHALRAHYDPSTGEIMPETVTSDYNWNIRSL